jgi:geranylgeranyl diphosphate synthase type I
MLNALEADLRQAVRLPGDSRYAGIGEMISHHFGWSDDDAQARGKRIRPLLTLLSCAALGGEWQSALPAATAVELIHNFSLVHDDIQDNSTERRGRPTVWSLWGVPQAINTGDALLVMGRIANHRLLDQGVAAATVLEVQRLLDLACLRLTEGQHLDLAFERREAVTAEEYLGMIEGKTAALVSAACGCGALVADATPRAVEACRQFGRHLGLAFQITDDLLGIWGEPSVTGKPAGDDLRSRKKTLPAVYGLATSADFRRLWEKAASEAADISAMAGALEACGARAHVQEAANEHTNLALAELERASLRGDAGTELRDLAARLLARDR